ncbi:hypothetical protein [Anaeromicropila herbilytica]|uniref:Uncharacterized protein n=1 Tax=Anaeromicropila herbilytica TaxID=2785025 RepID=A0A7R7IE59_9FIRM|nr:hypothetical protein [Anaeromicropila herbilytica]BCN32287.1 hypothetical protein bsdtb5_35820 [Anaeromicropila herbilytica]
MTRDSYRKKRYIISILMTFILSISMFSLFCAVMMYFNFGDQKVITNSLTESKYYDKVAKDINERIKEIATNHDIPEEVLLKVISSEKITVESVKYIERTLQGKEAKIHSDDIEDAMIKQVTLYLADQNVTITEQLKDSIHILAKECKVVYENKIELKFIDYYKQYQAKVFHWLKITIPVILVILAVCSVVLVRMYRLKHQGVRFLAYSMIATIYLSVIANILYKPLKGMDITPAYYKSFIDTYIQKCRMQNNILIYIEIFLLVLILLGIKVLKKTAK